MNETSNTKNPDFISLNEAAELKTGIRITFFFFLQALYAEA